MVNTLLQVAYVLSTGAKIYLDDFECHGHYVLYCIKHASVRAHHKNMNEDRRTLSAAQFSFWFMQTFAEVVWRGGVKQQWGQQRRFSVLSVVMSSEPTVRDKANIITLTQ